MNGADTESPSVPDVFVSLRGRPVRLERGFCGWSAHAVERGYFPVSVTGYRSFATGTAPIDPPSLDSLEDCAEKQEASIAATLKAARAALRSRFATGPGCGVSAFIHLSGAATQALEAGFFAPDALRPLLWDAAYQLFQRIAHDPVARPSPEGAAEAWNARQCEKAHAGSLRVLEDLSRFMSGDFTRPEDNGNRFRYFTSYFDLPARAEVALPIPSLELGVYPAPLTAAQANAALDAEDDSSGDMDTEGEEGVEPVAGDQLTFFLNHFCITISH